MRLDKTVNRFVTFIAWGFLSLPLMLRGQEASDPPPPPAETWWSVHFQATSIGQHHGDFPALYSGPNSLPDHAESRVSLTATAFLAARFGRWQFVINPEDAGGEGFGNVTGIAGFTNGEMPRVQKATPTLYLARGYASYTIPFGTETEHVDDGPNQVAGARPVSRLTLTAGKFALTDFFDTNAYSDDPRGQFMNWSIMYNGAWDYPADTRGYTVGVLAELTERRWSLRVAQALMSTFANGPILDWRVAENRGNVAEWETRYSPGGQAGVLRILGFANSYNGGNFREAILANGTTDLADTRSNGTLKYGFGLSLEQAITHDVGVFARYGWSDGKNEDFEFSQIDRSLSGGVSVGGARWRRAADRVGVAAVRNYLSGDQRVFLADGGLGFLIGDGRLNYRPETVLETYYAFQVVKFLTVSLDYQRVENPAYNYDRGPVNVYSLRLHVER
jgi:high affinity Mn2+ porin